MKALSLWQPWAFLVKLAGHIDPDIAKLGKHFETRSWPTKYRGPLAIHAAKDRQYWKVAHEEPFRSVLMEARLFRQDDLPYGAIVATCNLVECCLIKEDGLYRLIPWLKKPAEMFAPLPTEPELSFGDYTPGRFAWILEDVRQLPEPIPVKGHQGLWKWEPPEGVLIA